MWLVLASLLALASAECPPTDVIFLVDGSSSLGEANFIKEIGFVKQMIAHLGLSPDGNRAIVVQYTDEVTREHKGILTDVGTALTVCRNIHYHMGASFLDTALEYTSAAFKEVERPNGNRVVFIVTDGESQTDPLPMASKLRSEGVHVAALLVTRNLVQEGDDKMFYHALEQLRETTNGNLYTVQDFKLLTTKLAKNMAQKICEIGGTSSERLSAPPADAPVDQNCIVEYSKATTCSATCGAGEKHQFGRVVQPQLGSGKPCSPLMRVIGCINEPCEGGPVVDNVDNDEPVDCQVIYGETTPCSATCGGGLKFQMGRVVTPPRYGGAPCPRLQVAIPCNQVPCPPPMLDIPSIEEAPPSPGDALTSDQKSAEGPSGQSPDASKSVEPTESTDGEGSIPIDSSKSVDISESGAATKPEPSDPSGTDQGQEQEVSRLPEGENTSGGQVSTSEGDGAAAGVGGPSGLGQQLIPPVDLGSGTIPSNTFGEVPSTPVDCKVDWTVSDCTKSCGGGILIKQGSILQYPTEGGKPCPDLVVDEPCNQHPCEDVVDCEVQYGDWSICTETCGQGFRVRPVHVIKAAANGGKACPERRFEQEDCKLKDCPTALDFDCSKYDDGDYQLSVECSNNYVTCAVGTPILRHCPPGLYFSPLEKVCDGWLYACGHRTRPTTTTTVHMTTTTTPPPPIDCSTIPEGNYPDPLQNCSGIFYTCDHGLTVLRLCPVGLLYSNRTQRCDEYQNVYECTGQVYELPEVETEKAPVVEQSHPIDCLKLDTGDYEHPAERCSRLYYTCDNGRAIERECVSGTYFAQELVRCMQRQYVPSCGGVLPTTANGTTPAPKAHKTNYPDGPNCHELDIGNYPAGGCEHHYYTCNFDSVIRRECPHHLFYDAEFDRCELRKYMPTCGGTRPITTTRKPGKREEIFDCSSKADGGYPDNPSVCSQEYVMCANGASFRFECPGKLYFDPESKDCLTMSEIKNCL